MISIVIPTINGREDSLQQVMDAYSRTTKVKYEIVVISNAPTWPDACNLGFERSKGDVIHFGADDLEPLPGWHKDVLKALRERDELPAAAVYDYKGPNGLDPSGPLYFMNEMDGADGELTHFTRVPIMTRKQWQRIGKWPSLIYFADMWLSEYARNTFGIRTRMLYSYAFVHHWSQIGRVDSKANLDEAGWHLNRLREQMI